MVIARAPAMLYGSIGRSNRLQDFQTSRFCFEMSRKSGDALLFVHMHRPIRALSHIYHPEGPGESLCERESPGMDCSYTGVQVTWH